MFANSYIYIYNDDQTPPTHLFEKLMRYAYCVFFSLCFWVLIGGKLKRTKTKNKKQKRRNRKREIHLFNGAVQV